MCAVSICGSTVRKEVVVIILNYRSEIETPESATDVRLTVWGDTCLAPLDPLDSGCVELEILGTLNSPSIKSLFT